MRCFVLIIFFSKLVSCTSFSFGQIISLKEIDSLSYRYYLTQDLQGFDNLIQKAEIANKGMYVLYLRHAMVLYDLGKFSKAITSLNKALEFGANDNLVLEYLYYCYLLTGNFEQAELILVHASAKLREKLRVKNSSLVSSVDVLGGYFPQSTIDLNYIGKIKTVTDLFKPSDLPLYISHNANKDMSFGQMTIESKISPRWLITNSFSGYGLNKRISYKVGNKIYPYDNTLLQYDYAHLSKLLLSNKWMLNFGYHFCYLVFDSYLINIKMPQLFPVITFSKTNLNNHLVNIGIHKIANQGFLETNFSLASLGGSVNVLQLDLVRRLVLGKKGSFFLDAKIAYLNQSAGNTFVINPKVGYRFTKKYVSEAVLHYGSLMNYQEQYGMNFFNLADNITFRLGINQYYSFFNKVTLGFYSAFMQRQGYYFSIYPTKEEIQSITYEQFSFVGSIRVRF